MMGTVRTGAARPVRRRLIGLLRRSPWLAGLPREVVILAMIAFCVALGFGIVAPAIPIFATSFGVSAFAAGAVVSVFALMRFVSAPGAGGGVNRLGERVVLSSGLIIVAISSLLAGLAGTYTQLVVMRGIGGVGSAMFTVAAMALLLRTTNHRQRGRASSAFQAGFLFGGVTGPAVGGLVMSVSLRAPFFLYSATLVLATVVAVAFLRSPPHPDSLHPDRPAGAVDPAEESAAHATGTVATTAGDDGSPVDPPAPTLRSAIRQHSYRTALIANLNNGLITFGIRMAIVPLFVTKALDLGPVWAGFGFLVSAIFQALSLVPAGRIADQRGRRPAMILGAVATLAGMITLVIGLNAVVYLLAMMLLGVGGAFLGSAPPAVVGDVIGNRPGGTVVSTFQMISDFGAVCGPLLAGWLADVAGFHAAFSVGVITAAALLIMAIRMPTTVRADRPIRMGPAE